MTSEFAGVDVPRTFEVVSPEFPCGSAWLANCLFELGVPSWHLWGFDTRQEWTSCGEGRYRYSDSNMPWRQTLASLQPGREFSFEGALGARFSHQLPWEIAPARQIVLIVRDPRDALYSEWQRHKRNFGLPTQMQLPEFLGTSFFGGPISMADMLWLHLKSWLSYRAAMPRRVLLLRFEDWKRTPAAELRRVCKWIGLDRDDDALERAADASDVRRLQSIEKGIAASSSNARQFNRRGEPNEWRSAWQSDWFEALGAQWMSVLDALGYMRHDARVASRIPALPDVLRWRGLVDEERNRIWRELIEG